MKVVILAGGMGTRISEESYLRPKPMIEIGGYPILWHIMKHYSHYGFNDFIICCGYKGYMIKEYFANYYLHTSDLTFDFSSENSMTVHNNVSEPWRVTLVDTGLNTDTGSRVARVRKYIGDNPFLFTYGDGVSNIDLHSLVDAHRSMKTIVTLSSIQPGGRFGVMNIDHASNRVCDFKEKAKKDGGWINAGFMVMEPEIFSYLDWDNCVLESSALVTLSHMGQVSVHKHDGFWMCMDTQRERYILESMWEKKQAPWKIW